MSRRITLLLLALPLVASTCTNGGDDGAGPDAGVPRELALRLELAANLEPFDDCDQLVDYFEDAVASEGAPLFLRPAPSGGDVAGGRAALAEDMAVTAGEAGATGAAEAVGAGAAPPGPAATGGDEGFSATNIQEAGVDEPDIVKTDGRLIVAVAQGRLQVVEPAGPDLRVIGSVALPEGSHELFLHDDRAIVLTRSWQAVALGDGTVGGGTVGGGAAGGSAGVAEDAGVAVDMIAPGTSATVVSAVDLSDPSHPAVSDSATFEGDYVAARLHEGMVRLVLRSSPAYQVVPAPGVPAETTIEQWLPDRLAVQGTEGGVSTAVPTEPLVPCEAVTRPPEPSGVGTVTVLTIDAGDSMQPVDSDAVVADAQTVYASTETLFVATNQVPRSPEDAESSSLTTELHAFDISDPGQTTYLASGRVRGQLLNQWSLSEHEGHLRVATTDGSPWIGTPEGRPSSESFLTVLRRDGERLAAVGQLGGLGRGEQIYAVRYVGSLGFVVTFRQTDPLYALDLTDPANPRLLGELKIPGFSAYLHPIGSGRMLGVGQDATEEGRRLGTQVSLFDISDPSALRRLDQAGIENASSAVEYDHRAFLWWPASDLAVVPIEIYAPPVAVPLPVPEGGSGREVVEVAPDVAAAPPFLGVAAFRLDGDDIALAGRFTHAGKVAGANAPEYYAPPAIQRALVVDGSLYTLSELGMMASDLASLEEQGWATF